MTFISLPLIISKEETAMPEYQLQIKQVVDYPRCRIYREFIHKLINDRSIRINGGSGLFHFTVLCSYANFRTSYRRIDGISYTVSPGEWVCTVKELSCWFRTRFHRQALSMLDTLQKQHLISYTLLGRGNDALCFDFGLADLAFGDLLTVNIARAAADETAGDCCSNNR
jgi:hypothetical protein